MKHFSPEALAFLRSLHRNNRREWFTPRKPIFDAQIKAPMLALIAELNEAMLAFAPEHIRPPQKALLRIYRDTRFSNDKTPYKQHVAAWWSRDGLPKTSGAGFYFHIGHNEVAIAAGVYMPQPDQLLAIRRHLLTHHNELRRMLASKKIQMLMPNFTGHELKRSPKGFDPDHPGADLILCRQWGFSGRLPAAAALDKSLVKEIITRFKAAAPIIHLLNAPLLAPAEKRKPIFGF